VPNWTDNVLTVTGRVPVLKAFLAAVESEERPFDFNRIIPMPEILGHTGSGTREIEGKRVDRWYVIDPDFPPDRNDTENVRLLTFEEMLTIDALGVKTWYDWSTKNWGTKWNACEPEIGPITPRDPEFNLASVVIEFRTAWSAPIPILKRLRATYRLTFRLRCHYEDSEPGTWETI
jgi:hypothetical protein